MHSDAFIRETICFRYVLGVLAAAKSKCMRKWKTIDGVITDRYNEARDNVK